MSKKAKHAIHHRHPQGRMKAEAVEQEPEVVVAPPTAPTIEPAEVIEKEAEAEPKVSSSVVNSKFKQRYTANARELGIKGKAARRSNWDWLAQEIARRCLDTKHHIDMTAFLAILEANGIDHKKWPNRERGWEGRLRMTGRVALQRIVADAGVLKLPKSTLPGGAENKTESTLEVPADFIEKYKSK